MGILLYVSKIRANFEKKFIEEETNVDADLQCSHACISHQIYLNGACIMPVYYPAGHISRVLE